MKKLGVCLLLFSLCSAAFAQRKKHHKSKPETGPQINYALNRIFCGEIDAFYQKLQLLEKTKKGILTVVQLGDSHTQPDFISSVVRDAFQQRFGNAGRGMVFPYQLAKSNAPLDIVSSSTSAWEFNRLTHPEIDTNSGLSGFVLESAAKEGNFTVGLKDKANGTQCFNSVRLFLKKSSATRCRIYSGLDTFDYQQQPITFSAPVSSFGLNFSDNDSSFQFYGASLQNGQSGVLYHNIGVNGARYDHYNLTENFWQQLPALHADLIIVSLGTNEAQRELFEPAAFDSILHISIAKIKAAAPQASILITTAADSYKGEGSNKTLKILNSYLEQYCQKNQLALWDLYKVTNGYGSAKKWFKKGMMSKDRIHFVLPGYQLQGVLLLDCLMKGYEKFNARHP